MPSLLKKIAEKKTFPNLYSEASITLIPKPDKDSMRKENYRPIALMTIDAKIFSKILANCVQYHIKRIICHGQLGCKDGPMYVNEKNVTYHIKRLKLKSHNHLSRGRKGI
jgi:hypothetical protein